MLKRFLLALLCWALTPPVLAAIEKFVVKDIRVVGLQRIAAGTVFNYLPVKVGDTIADKQVQDAIRALYKTGFFRDVRLARQGNVLVVTVVERPSIAGIRILGTKEFSEEDLKKSLKQFGLTDGRVFDRSLLDRIEQELRQQYFSRGFYAVIVKPTVTPLERNRVDITIDVHEGSAARIRSINLVGNEIYKDKELRELFTLGPRPWWAVFSSRDQYSKQTLTGDLERLRHFYQDRGYLDFRISSTQVSITPDKSHIYITVNVEEGKKYRIKGTRLVGRLPVPEKELAAMITIKPGDVFSRRLVADASKSITDRLANDGYAFANVNPEPEIDKAKSEVFFTFHVDPGKRVYVRRVNFSGNTATRDDVLRQETRQLESGWYSAEQIKRTRTRLQRLGFFEDVNVETPPVAGTPDQVDVNVKVKERATGNINLGVGYSDTDGVIVNASVTQSNLFGSGRELSVSFDNSQSTTNFNVRYVNPYYTQDGVTRGFNAFSSTVDAAQAGTAAYNTTTVGAGVFYSIPLSEDNRIFFGLDVEQIQIETNPASAQVAQDFVARYGDSNSMLKATVSWAKDTLDSTLLPTSGTVHRISGEVAVPGSDITYYKFSYFTSRYWPVTARSSFKTKLELSYGGGYGDTTELPFYKNYFAGGSTTLRGYRSRSLGPRDTLPPNDPIGGNRRVLVNAEYLFPMPGLSLEDKSIRLSVFADGGMVYGRDQPLDLGELRYSAGLAFNWFSPVGPLSFSLAKPLNAREGDRTESFQFTLGVPFR